MRRSLVVAFMIVECLFIAIVVAGLLSGEKLDDPKWIVLLLPALMLADYYLTILYGWLIRGFYKIADLAIIELNPMWKADVARLRIVNLRHVVHVVFFTLLFLIISTAPEGSPKTYFLCLFGFAIGVNASLVAEHIQNLSSLLRAFRKSTRRHTSIEIRNTLDRDRYHRQAPRFSFGPARVAVFGILLSSALVFGPFFALGGIIGQWAEWGLRYGLQREANHGRRGGTGKTG
jgi:hypothetical protein